MGGRPWPWLLGSPVSTEAAAAPAGRGDVPQPCAEPGFVEERRFWGGRKRTRGCAHTCLGLSPRGQERVSEPAQQPAPWLVAAIRGWNLPVAWGPP